MSTFRGILGDGAAATMPAAPSLPTISVPSPQAMATGTKSLLKRIPLSVPVAVGVTAVSTLLMFLFARRQAGKAIAAAGNVATGATSVGNLNRDAIKKMGPKGTEYLVDLAFEIAPQYGVDPLLVLAITNLESRWGAGLTPKGDPGGTGDFIPRPDSQQRRAAAAAVGLQLQNVGGKIKPVGRGWGWGLYQIDVASHYNWLKKGLWKDPKEAMRYMITNVLLSNKKALEKAYPNLSQADLWYLTVVSYNAGVGGVKAAMGRKGNDPRKVDQAPKPATYHPGYASRILNQAETYRKAASGVA